MWGSPPFPRLLLKNWKPVNVATGLTSSDMGCVPLSPLPVCSTCTAWHASVIYKVLVPLQSAACNEVNRGPQSNKQKQRSQSITLTLASVSAVGTPAASEQAVNFKQQPWAFSKAPAVGHLKSQTPASKHSESAISTAAQPASGRWDTQSPDSLALQRREKSIAAVSKASVSLTGASQRRAGPLRPFAAGQSSAGSKAVKTPISAAPGSASFSFGLAPASPGPGVPDAPEANQAAATSPVTGLGTSPGTGMLSVEDKRAARAAARMPPVSPGSVTSALVPRCSPVAQSQPLSTVASDLTICMSKLSIGQQYTTRLARYLADGQVCRTFDTDSAIKQFDTLIHAFLVHKTGLSIGRYADRMPDSIAVCLAGPAPFSVRHGWLCLLPVGPAVPRGSRLCCKPSRCRMDLSSRGTALGQVMLRTPANKFFFPRDVA